MELDKIRRFLDVIWELKLLKVIAQKKTELKKELSPEDEKIVENIKFKATDYDESLIVLFDNLPLTDMPALPETETSKALEIMSSAATPTVEEFNLVRGAKLHGRSATNQIEWLKKNKANFYNNWMQEILKHFLGNKENDLTEFDEDCELFLNDMRSIGMGDELPKDKTDLSLR